MIARILAIELENKTIVRVGDKVKYTVPERKVPGHGIIAETSGEAIVESIFPGAGDYFMINTSERVVMDEHVTKVIED